MRGPETFPSRIEQIEAWLCRVPLPAPVEVAGTRIVDRDYAVVRMHDSDGVEGSAFGLARGAPVDLVVADVLAPALIGSAADPSAIETRAAERLVMIGGNGIAARARSLLDICAWDIAGTRAGEPVWRLLNGGAAGLRGQVPGMLVEGYPMLGEPAEGLAERMGRAERSGFRHLKLARQGDPEHMDRLLALTRAATGQDVSLTLDCTWAWRTNAPAEQAVRLWARHGLAWIEDPFPAEMSDAISALRRNGGVPIAVGDEVTRPSVFDQLVEARAVDVIRLDATTIGGFSAFGRVVERIPELQVSPHVFPEVHRHCAFAWPRVTPLELFRPDAGFDVAHRFVEPVTTERGNASAPTRPGLGLTIDWEAVSAHAIRSSTATPDRVTAR